MRVLFGFLLVLFLTPAFGQDRWPDEAPEAWGLAIVDVETTGLDPSFHEMIDAGLIYTTVEGVELGRLYLRIMPDHPERLAPGALAVNGFNVDDWRANGAVSEAQAVAALTAFHERVGAGRTMIFTAFNVQFDIQFMGALLAQHGRSWRDYWHWSPLDLPSMAWGQGTNGLRGTRLAQAFGLPPETSVPLDHTGMTGAQWNLDFYRAMLARRAAP
jgi:DNA polymerase III epsilon subunit-like protein